MEIVIKTTFGEMKFEMEQEKMMQVLQTAMSFATETVPGLESQTSAVPQHPEPKTQLAKPRSRVESLFPNFRASKPQKIDEDTKQGYKGFLLVKCADCGSVWGFCSKAVIIKAKCRCGNETPLSGLKPAYLECKCGSHYKYMTNIADDQFTYKCLNCGAPVDMALNKNGTAYLPLERLK
ncbi:MAG: hypothetical protein HFE88_04570 [Acutalibacter sp.]|nr:hypothetical protein [Acutalibacter sp.]